MMSMLGINMLERIVAEKQILNPTHILEQMNRYVSQSLRQQSSDNQDGMDMGVCTIYLEHNRLYFAGARHSLYTAQAGKEVNEIKGDRYHIGGNRHPLKEGFSQHEVKIEKGLSLYMSSDGLQDQFGGSERRKFSSKRLRTFMQEHAHLPMQQQVAMLESTLNTWMEASMQKQTDDICCWGWKAS
jgi:serine phosphatase RsbU (regulator of sigma subunit)